MEPLGEGVEPADLRGGVAMDSLLAETVNRDPRIQHMCGEWSRPWALLTVCGLSLLQLLEDGFGEDPLVSFLLSILNLLLKPVPEVRPGLAPVLDLGLDLGSPGLILLNLCLDTDTRFLGLALFRAD